MTSKLINNGELKTYAVVFDDRDEVIKLLGDFAKEKNLKAAQFTGMVHSVR